MLLDYVLRALAKDRTMNQEGASLRPMTLRRLRTDSRLRYADDVGLLFDAWADMDDVLVGLSPEQMLVPYEGGSSFAWTLGHTAHVLDAWINVRFQHHSRHSVIGHPNFAMGGSGIVEDWHTVHQGVVDVRERARSYLEALKPRELDVVIPYDGSIVPLRDTGLSLRYALLRNTVHHYYHIGEIATTRARLGHQIPPFPGPLSFYLTGQER